MMGFPKNWAVAALMEGKHILKVGEILICLFSLQASHDEASPAPRGSTMMILAHYDKCPPGFTIACSSARGTSCKGCCCSFQDADICRCSVGSCMDRESAENKRRRRITRSGTAVCLAERANTSRLHRLNASATFQQKSVSDYRNLSSSPHRARSRTLFDRINTSMEISMLISCVR